MKLHALMGVAVLPSFREFTDITTHDRHCSALQQQVQHIDRATLAEFDRIMAESAASKEQLQDPILTNQRFSFLQWSNINRAARTFDLQ